MIHFTYPDSDSPGPRLSLLKLAFGGFLGGRYALDGARERFRAFVAAQLAGSFYERCGLFRWCHAPLFLGCHVWGFR